MDAKIIYDALKMYKDRGCHDDATIHAIDRLMKDAEDFRRLSYSEVNNGWCSGRIHFVSTDFAITAMNLRTYNIFGKLAKKHGADNVPLLDYMLQIHYFEDCCIIPSIIEMSAAYLSDLWADNERYGANREDGTFGG